MNQLVTIATFDLLPDAHIAMGRLQIEGVPCRLADENLVQTDWLYSIAVGGIKLQVDRRDAELAQEILSRDYSQEQGEFAADDAGRKR